MKWLSPCTRIPTTSKLRFHTRIRTDELGPHSDCEHTTQPFSRAQAVQICEKDVGLRIRLEMLVTIDSKLYFGELDNFFQSGSERKASHLAFISARSGKLSI